MSEENNHPEQNSPLPPAEESKVPPAAEVQKPPEEAPQAPPPEFKVGVIFADGRVLAFDPGRFQLKIGDLVTVENEKDLNLGRVVYLVPNRHGERLPRVLSRVGPQDWMLIRRNQEREQEAYALCCKMIAEMGLPMKLVRVAYLHGGNKAIFYFSSEGRVDFRALVRSLAQQLHVRIEMRQIGVRDESRMLGGIGICGQQLCCCRFLQRLHPVSIKMAKNQQLSLNPQKLSGVCGRLMCCLAYEDQVYLEHRRLLPRPGETVITPQGEGKVVELDLPRCLVRVQLGETVVTFTREELKSARSPQPGVAEEEELPAELQQLEDETSSGENQQRQPEGSEPTRKKKKRRRRRKKNKGGGGAPASEEGQQK